MERAPARTLRLKDAVAARREMLNLPHVAPLRLFCERLRAEGRGVVADFDPLDGGVAATVLFLMEKPGPMTDETAGTGRAGSGFISRDNDDATAEAILRFMEQAGIDRERSILWNTVPWWNGMRRISPGQLAAGKARLPDLIRLLPGLRVVVGVGAKARSAENALSRSGLPFLHSAHPSPINRAARPALWTAIPVQWAAALAHIDR